MSKPFRPPSKAHRKAFATPAEPRRPPADRGRLRRFGPVRVRSDDEAIGVALATQAEWIRSGRDVCVLCERPGARLGGIYFLGREGSRRLGIPEGTTRSIGYMLCSDCVARPDWMERVEDAVTRDLRRDQAERASRN